MEKITIIDLKGVAKLLDGLNVRKATGLDELNDISCWKIVVLWDLSNIGTYL